MFVLMSQEILTREVRAFLRKHDVSLAGFDRQVDEISKSTYKFYNVHVGEVFLIQLWRSAPRRAPSARNPIRGPELQSPEEKG